MNNETKSSHEKVLFMAQAGVIAAIYVVLTIFINAFNLASGAIQIRISEALCVLPFFTPAAVPGLAIGCLLSNILTGCAIWDVIFGTLATLLGAIFSYKLRKHKFLVTLPPVIANAVIIPFILCYAYGLTGAWMVGNADLSLLFYALTVGAGEVISVCVLGTLLRKALEPVAKHIFNTN
ncbi:MAG: QueT transporter family protein [Lachnospiraceae bacterium]|nr:QueT transporter family protein [Lachnospiraceae bacterium]